jgi:hypothetical protein
MVRYKEALMQDRGRLLELALKGLQAERAKIDDEIAQLRKQLGGGGGRSEMNSAQPRKRRKMSAAARKKISEAMKRRHAERRKLAGKKQA